MRVHRDYETETAERRDRRLRLYKVTLGTLSTEHVGDIFEAILGVSVLKNLKLNAAFNCGDSPGKIATLYPVAEYVAAFTELYVIMRETQRRHKSIEDDDAFKMARVLDPATAAVGAPTKC